MSDKSWEPGMSEQSDPTDLTRYVPGYTGIRMPVRLELYRHTYACLTESYRHTYACITRVAQAYVCLCDSKRDLRTGFG